MNFGMSARIRIRQAVLTAARYLRRNSRADSEGLDEPVVFAVTNCYPTRIVLYAAAFQGGWKVRFMKSLGDVLEAAYDRVPKAVFYDQDGGDPAWERYCSFFSFENVPFVLLAHTNADETFLRVVAAGGYQAWGNPLTSEEIVRAVTFAGEVAGLPRVPVVQG